MLMKRVLIAGGLLITAVVSTACSGGAEQDSAEHDLSVPPAPFSTTPGVVGPAPEQAAVRFDPCVGLDDDLISRVGFDPTSRQRNDIVASPLTRIGCTYNRIAIVDGEKTLTGGMTVASMNAQVNLARGASDAVFNTDPIDGRATVLYTIPELPHSCHAEVASADGSLQIMLVAFPGPIAVPDPCGEIRGVAETFATVLPS